MIGKYCLKAEICDCPHPPAGRTENELLYRNGRNCYVLLVTRVTQCAGFTPPLIQQYLL